MMHPLNRKHNTEFIWLHGNCTVFSSKYGHHQSSLYMYTDTSVRCVRESEDSVRDAGQGEGKSEGVELGAGGLDEGVGQQEPGRA